jgi:hypothetical protein
MRHLSLSINSDCGEVVYCSVHLKMTLLTHSDYCIYFEIIFLKVIMDLNYLPTLFYLFPCIIKHNFPQDDKYPDALFKYDVFKGHPW